MTKRNDQPPGSPPRDTGPLRPSTKDHSALAAAVEDKFLLLCRAHESIRGVQLRVPKSLWSAFFLWRAMRVRHKRGDRRHTAAELSAVKEVAEWTLDVNWELRGQKDQPRPKVVWPF